jgi:AraC family transcriptional regulator, regulatory protein of adaptative response / DNA-3-methyladenine glycosylase II
MQLDPAICHRALRSRDPRFDGRFFTGVTSTGIYCRPVCPARTPQAANCVFFVCAAAAEDAGFRPCRRCRPETAPGTPAWLGTGATVTRALRLIEEGALDAGGVDDLADRLGIGARQLRRLFADHLGASPLALARTRRVHAAKRLIEETALPMGQIALAAGFSGTRRFNADLRRSFDRSPREIRRAAGAGSNGGITLRLSYREPFDWTGLLAFLAPRAIPGVETVASGRYRRSVELGDFRGVIELAPDPRGWAALILRAPVEASAHLAAIAHRLRTLCDLDADPTVITTQLGASPRLAKLVKAAPGLRVPGAWCRFELAVRAILGQQITVAGATTLAGRLVKAFGSPLADDPEGRLLFPRPEELVDADLAACGLTRSRAETLRGLARSELTGDGALATAASLDEALERLLALPGIGDWTAQYVAMRALREPDAFPAGDLGLRKALAENGVLPTASKLRAEAEAWRPWRAYAAMHLWRSLAARTEESS